MATLCFYFFLLLSGFPVCRLNCHLSVMGTSAGDPAGSPLDLADDHLREQGARGYETFPKSKDDVIALLDKVIDALEDGLTFLEKVRDQLNVDAVIGSRIVEGQLTVLLSRLMKKKPDIQLPARINKRIRGVQRQADKMSNEAIPYLKRRQPEYYYRIGAILKRGFWALSYGTRTVNSSAIIPPMFDGEAMNERMSDDCLTEFFGTSVKTAQECRISRGCWKLMTTSGFQHYSLTHQVFYAEIGTAFGCFTGKLRQLTDDLGFAFCANILVEAQTIAASGFPADKTDIFMEQAALCGILGFKEFFRPDWLHAILRWQRHPEGCWGENKTSSDQGRRLHKREEHVLADGCGCHRTAVAIGALVGYLRFIAESTARESNSTRYL